MGVLSLLSYYIILIHQERFMLLEYIRYSKFIDSFICGKVYFIIVFFVIIVIVISDTDSSISILSGKHRHVFILQLHQQILYLGKDVHVFLFRDMDVIEPIILAASPIDWRLLSIVHPTLPLNVIPRAHRKYFPGGSTDNQAATDHPPDTSTTNPSDPLATLRYNTRSGMSQWSPEVVFPHPTCYSVPS